MFSISTRQLTAIAALAAISALTQIFHIGWQHPIWQMWIDLVAVSWIIAYFLYGFKASLFTSILGTIVITIVEPTGILGSGMKFLATFCMVLPFFILPFFKKQNFGRYKQLKLIILPLVLGLVLRSAIMLPTNYFYALPFWLQMPPAVAWEVIPWYIIALFNTIQGIIDILLAWFIVHPGKLSLFSKNSSNQKIASDNV